MSFDVSVNDVLELKFYSHQQGQYAINTRHYRVTAIGGAGRTDANFCVAMDTLFAPLFKALMCTNAQYVGTSAQIIRNIRRPKTVVTGGSGSGTLDTDALPRQTAGLIQLKTDEASRHGRGRMYVPFPDEGSNSPLGIPTMDYITLLDNLAVKLDDVQTITVGADSATFQPVIYNRVTHSVIPVTSANTLNLWATCRRRSDVRGGDRPPF